MTRKEIVKRALAFEATDVVPYNFDFTRDARRMLRAHFGTDDVDEAVGNFCLQINVGSNAGAEINRVAAPLMESLGNDRYRDEFGVVWNKSGGDDIGVPENRVLAEPDAGLPAMPDPLDKRRWNGFDDIAATVGDRYLLAAFSSPLFQRAWFLHGMAETLMDFAAEPDFMAALYDRLTDFSIAIVREAGRRGADGMIFYDDYAQQSGLLFSPDMFRHFIKPRLRKIFAATSEAGLDVFFHCCGDVSAVLEDLCEIGTGMFNPFQPEVMDVAAIAKQFAGRMGFYGGVSTQVTLPNGSPDDVRNEVRFLRGLFREHGGFMLAPAHAVQRDVPLENILALIDAAH